MRDLPSARRDSGGPTALWCPVVVALTCLFVWWENIRALDLYFAATGWSAIDWVNHLRFPENFARDFPSGIAVYGRSAFMQVYPAALSLLGIEPETAVNWVVLLEVCVTAIAFLLLARSLDRNYPALALVILAALAVSSHARYGDLSRSAAPFFLGLYYGVADAARILGIALALRRAWIGSALAFAVSTVTHPVMGMTGAVFTAAAALANRATRLEVRSPRAIVGAASFLLIAAAWWYPNFARVSVVPLASADTWIRIGIGFNYHFFPVESGMFTTEHTDRFIPLVSLMLLACHYIGRDIRDSATRRALAAGLATLAVLTALGVAISVFSTNPTLIKLSLHRASGLMAIIGVVMAARGLVNDVLAGPRVRQALAVALLASLFLRTGLPLALSLLIVALDRFPAPRDGIALPWQRASIILGGIALALSAGYLAAGWIGSYQRPAYLGDPRAALVFLGYFVVAVAIGRPSLARFRMELAAGALVVTIVLFVVLWQEHRHMTRSEEAAFARDFKEAQLWARKSTPEGALFMVDPTIYYGWRDYSRRSSFGNMREWLMTSWLYDSDLGRFEEGRRRYEAFGVLLSDYLDKPPRAGAYHELSRELEERFYALDEKSLCAITQRFMSRSMSGWRRCVVG